MNSVIRTLTALRGDQGVRIASPRHALGQRRSNIRTHAPDGQNYQDVQRVAQALADQQYERVAAIVMLARTTGMHLREAIMADLPRLHREAKQLAASKSRTAPKADPQEHQCPVGISSHEQINAAIQLARDASQPRSRNLLAPE